MEDVLTCGRAGAWGRYLFRGSLRFGTPSINGENHDVVFIDQDVEVLVVVQITIAPDDTHHAIFFAMTHNPRECEWCAAIGARIQEHMDARVR